jgi:hypothetical protein
MRRVIALLLSCFVIAATAESGTLRCVSTTAPLGGSHRCCDDQEALSPAIPCCVVSQAPQPGPTESQVVAQAGAPCESLAAFVHAVGDVPRSLGIPPSAGSIASSVPIYLQHLSLLI